MKSFVINIKAIIRLIFNKKNHIVIDKSIFIPFIKKEPIFNLYFKSLDASNLRWSDNYYKQLRYYSLYQMAEFVASNKKLLNYDIAECGVWKGQSAYIISTIFKKNGFKKKFNIFDSFEGGLSKKSNSDENLTRKLSANEIVDESKIFSSTIDEVSKNLSSFPFVLFYPGWIPFSFKSVKSSKYSFVHIDVDLYQPTIDSLNYFWNLLVIGGVIVIDDYGSSQFPGATKAVDDFLKNKKIFQFYKVPMGSCFIIK